MPMTTRLVALLLCVMALERAVVAQRVRQISLDFPHGELRLLVDRDGPSQLFYAAAPFGREVAAGTFNIDALRRQLTSRLQPVSAAETRPPGQVFGTVTLGFGRGRNEEYLIVDRAFAEGLLTRACANLVDDKASTDTLVPSACARLRSQIAASAAAAPKNMPQALAALLGRARLDGPITAWCAAQYRPHTADALALAITAPDGGRYVAVDADGNVSPLAAFAGPPDLACYTRTAAEDLHRSIKKSNTIEGEIVPRFDSTVVCGFIDATSARCWQFAPQTRTFVVVGGWVT
jgi:hypothetical protein